MGNYINAKLELTINYETVTGKSWFPSRGQHCCVRSAGGVVAIWYRIKYSWLILEQYRNNRFNLTGYSHAGKPNVMARIFSGGRGGEDGAVVRDNATICGGVCCAVRHSIVKRRARVSHLTPTAAAAWRHWLRAREARSRACQLVIDGAGGDW